ncbi:unnamed protein product [Chironomus riparius]|uniref:Uncharacterized protein n=1 Tax=Chironomus riparius TaxID=315576 RepID=A0A9N9WVX2_9DIPT|nr:unnamed protein product [Chironomus riparius]
MNLSIFITILCIFVSFATSEFFNNLNSDELFNLDADFPQMHSHSSFSSSSGSSYSSSSSSSSSFSSSSSDPDANFKSSSSSNSISVNAKCSGKNGNENCEGEKVTHINSMDCDSLSPKSCVTKNNRKIEKL